jgi:hypothetical protein
MLDNMKTGYGADTTIGPGTYLDNRIVLDHVQPSTTAFTNGMNILVDSGSSDSLFTQDVEPFSAPASQIKYRPFF